MEIKQLEYFVQIVDCGTFSAAAQKNFITQSALSKIIKKLEVELGTDLLYSKGKNTVPTDTGKILYRQAKKILHECESTQKQIEELKGNPTGPLRITVSGPWNRMTNVYHMITDFIQKYPEIVLTISRMDSNNYKENLAIGSTDIAIVCGSRPDATQFECLTLLQSQYYLILPKDMPLAEKSLIEWEDILDLPFVLFTPTFQLHQIVLENFHKFGREPQIHMTADQPDLLLHVAAKNHWCTIWGDPLTVSDKMQYDMVSIPMNVSHEITLLRRKEAYSSQAERVFLEFVRENWELIYK
jgi:DNA-binding transcriptional LysR family regulator